MYKRVFTDSRVVPAPAEEIFALLADPARHSESTDQAPCRRLFPDRAPCRWVRSSRWP